MGKEEIIYLLTKAIEKYKAETGQEIIQNTNRKNYEALAILLSEISNQLPAKSEEFGTENYSPDTNLISKDYPHRKYDITGGQIKDALIGIVSNPRPFLVDACYIFLYGIGRKMFKQNPLDENLLEVLVQVNTDENILTEKRNSEIKQQNDSLKQQNFKKGRIIKIMSGAIVVVCIAIVTVLLTFFNSKTDWQTIKNDMNILPYQPTRAEIDSLEGAWICYTGSPQARISEPNRYHLVVLNVVEIKYKNGYFSYNRYGASFNHTGFAQFEAPGLVSLHSHIKNNAEIMESPRHSLMQLGNSSGFIPIISASWSFDVGDKNKIIGIREVYKKLGKGGNIEEVINTTENASCKCKIVIWQEDEKNVQTFQLKNQLLDSLSEPILKNLLDEKSIILREPQAGVIISNDSTNR